MSRYRVVEGAPSVSLDKKLYAPGELLPETVNDEAVEQLLKNGAIEKASAKDESKAEQKAAEASEEQKAKAAEAQKAEASAPSPTSTTVGDTESAKPTTAVTSAPSDKKTTGTNKPPAK